MITNLLNHDYNYDLIVPMMIIVIIVRTQSKIFNIPQRLLYGLRLFLPKEDNESTYPKVSKSLLIDNKFKHLNLGPILTINNSLFHHNFLSSQVLYGFYQNNVNIFIVAILMHIWNICFHCINPYAKYSQWGTIFAIFSLILSWQCQLYFLYLTGFKSTESKLSFIVGIIFAIIFSLYFLFKNYNQSSESFNWTEIDNNNTNITYEKFFEIFGFHINSILSLLSNSLPQLTSITTGNILKLLIILFTTLTTIGQGIPSLRFAQTFHVMNYGIKIEQVSKITTIILWIDFIFPLLVSLIFLSDSIFLYFNIKYQINFSIQLSLFVAMGILKFILMKVHLQSFLGSVVRSISLQIACNEKDKKNEFQKRIKAKVNYLIPATLQYISNVIFILSLSMLIYKLSLTVDYNCIYLRNLFNYDNSRIIDKINYIKLYDTTGHINDIVGEPYLDEAIMSFLLGTGQGGSPSAKLFTFFTVSIHKIQIIPTILVIPLAKSFIIYYCFSQFIVSTLSLFYWKFNPELLSLASGGSIRMTDASSKLNHSNKNE
jgi:hypothetical protein